MTHKELIMRRLKDECKKQIQYFMSLSDDAFLKYLDNPNCKIEVNLSRIVNEYWYDHVRKTQNLTGMTINAWLNAQSQQ